MAAFTRNMLVEAFWKIHPVLLRLSGGNRASREVVP
jgi:hypothetical protein